MWVVGGLLLVGLALSAVAVGALVVLAASFGGETVHRDSFASDAEAAAFVSEHLPSALPPGVVVEDLTYQRFQDWHLAATVRFESAAALAEYVRRARQDRRQDPEYCGSPSATSEKVDYFLSKWSACGEVVASPGERVVRVVCFTR